MLVLSLVVVTVQSVDSLEDIFGADAYRAFASDLAAAIETATGHAARESQGARGSFLVVLPGLESADAVAVGVHINRAVPREIGHVGLLMPVDLEVLVETHDGITREVSRLDEGCWPEAVPT